MKDKEIKVSILTTIVLAVIMYFIDFRLSTGIVLGNLFSLLHLYLLTISANRMFKGKRIYVIKVFLGSILRYMIIAFPLILALLWPLYLNVYAVAFGFVLYKIILVIFAITYKD